MNLNVNDTIIYATSGICKVIGKKHKEFYGNSKEYYILKPINNGNSTIYAPVDSEKTAEKIFPILSADEIYSLLKTMPSESSIWISDDSTRKEKYRQILSSGDRIQLICLIRTLCAHGEEKKAEGKKLHAADERFMKEAEKILYEEFAHVLDIELDQVLPFIVEQTKSA